MKSRVTSVRWCISIWVARIFIGSYARKLPASPLSFVPRRSFPGSLLVLRGGGPLSPSSPPESNDPTNHHTVEEDNVLSAAMQHNGSDKPFAYETGKSDSLQEMDQSIAEATIPVDEIDSDPWNTQSIDSSRTRKRQRRLAQVVLDLTTRSGANGQALTSESIALRRLIEERCMDYRTSDEHESRRTRLPHPQQLLHSLAPKIPAIRHSPDVSHRIRSAPSDIDSGIAACLIATLGYLCDQYQYSRAAAHVYDESTTDTMVHADLVKDRRFEQLVECLVCGVHVRSRRHDWAAAPAVSSNETTSSTVTVDVEDAVETMVEEADFVQGLSIRDSCRAVWGLSVLRVPEVKAKLGGVYAVDLVAALLNRVRELLLARLKQLRHDDFLDAVDGLSVSPPLSIDERLQYFSDELAEDAATALWATAAARTYIGIASQPLVDVCCLILCTDPLDARRQAQEIEAVINATSTMVGSNDIVERLALSEAIEEAGTESSVEFIASANATLEFAPTHDRKLVDTASEPKSLLLEFLSPTELVDTVWSFATAVQLSENQTAKLAAFDSAFQEIAFDRILAWLDDRRCDPTSLSVDLAATSDSVPLNIALATGSASSGQGDGEMFVDDVSSVPVLNGLSTSATADSNEDLGKTAHSLDSSLPNTSIYSSPVDGLELIDASTIVAIESELENRAGNGSTKFLGDAKDTALDPIFTPSDFCAMVWSVTELHDPLRADVTSAVARKIAQIDPEMLANLSGEDIANLAWGIAKNIVVNWEAGEGTEATCMRWILAEVVRNRMQSSSILTCFHPAELSRLLWSVATFLASWPHKLVDARHDAVQLSATALIAASMHLEMYCTEDLVCTINASNNVLRSWRALTLSLLVASTGPTFVGVSIDD
jgi:hypothetical protein